MSTVRVCLIIFFCQWFERHVIAMILIPYEMSVFDLQVGFCGKVDFGPNWDDGFGVFFISGVLAHPLNSNCVYE